MLFLTLVLMRFPAGSLARGLGLGMAAGSLAGNMFCLKATAELVENAIENGWSDFESSAVPYLMIAGAILFATTNVVFLTKGMRECEALFMVAVYEGTMIVVNSLTGGLVLAEFAAMEPFNLFMYFVSMGLIVAGLLALVSGEVGGGGEYLKVELPAEVLTALLGEIVAGAKLKKVSPGNQFIRDGFQRFLWAEFLGDRESSGGYVSVNSLTASGSIRVSMPKSPKRNASLRRLGSLRHTSLSRKVVAPASVERGDDQKSLLLGRMPTGILATLNMLRFERAIKQVAGQASRRLGHSLDEETPRRLGLPLPGERGSGRAEGEAGPMLLPGAIASPAKPKTENVDAEAEERLSGRMHNTIG